LKTRISLSIAFFSLLMLGMSCTYHSRFAESGLTADDVTARLDNIRTKTASTMNGNVVETLMQDPNTVVYFAWSRYDGSNPMGPTYMVTPLSAGFLDSSLTMNAIEEIFVYYLVQDLEEGYIGALVFEYKMFGQTDYTVQIFANDMSQGLSIGSIEDDYFFEMPLASGTSHDNRTLMARSYDVDATFTNPSLQAVIQLELYRSNPDGTEEFMGQISSMESFGQ
jgi:hypothetical protein